MVLQADYAIDLNSDKVTGNNKNAGSNLDRRVSSKDGIVNFKYPEEPNHNSNNAYPVKDGQKSKLSVSKSNFNK